MPYATIEQLRRLPPRSELRCRTRAWVRVARRGVLARPPFLTVVLIAVVAATFVRLQHGGQLPTLEFLREAFYPRALVNGQWDRVATATLLCRDVFMCVSICVSLLVALGTYEVLAGHLRAVVVIVGGAVLGPVSVTAGLGLLQAGGIGWAAQPMDTVDIGASAIVAAASGAIAGTVRRRLFTYALVAFVAGGVLVHHQLADWEHLLVLPAGYAFGHLTGAATLPATSQARSRFRRWAGWWPWIAAAAIIAVALPASDTLLPSPATPHTPAATPAPRSGERAQTTPHALAAAPAPRSGERAQTAPPTSQPRLVTASFPAPALGGSRGVLVLLPAGYDGGRLNYPVVVFLHGDPGSPRDLISAADIPSAAQKPGVARFIAVMPDGRGPKVSASWYANIAGQQMGTALTRDLRAWVTATFRTDGSYSYAGLSSGGYGAAYLAIIDPRPVHAVCGLSGRYDANIPVFASAGAAARQAASPIAHANHAPSLTFLAYGIRDGTAAVQAHAYADALRKTGRNVVVREYPGGHSWDVWRAAFADCLATILPATNPLTGHTLLKPATA